MDPASERENASFVGSKGNAGKFATLDGKVDVITLDHCRVLLTVDTQDLERDVIALIDNDLIGIPAIGRHFPASLSIWTLEFVPLAVRKLCARERFLSVAPLGSTATMVMVRFMPAALAEPVDAAKLNAAASETRVAAALGAIACHIITTSLATERELSEPGPDEQCRLSRSSPQPFSIVDKPLGRLFRKPRQLCS